MLPEVGGVTMRRPTISLDADKLMHVIANPTLGGFQHYGDDCRIRSIELPRALCIRGVGCKEFGTNIRTVEDD